ncbi:MAG: glycosyltransferase family 2 protein [Desulfobulbaceae bacterium]|nr:glycosyltransferase family 2 protein [Desulfobulbaceae bacterium]
MMNPSSEGAAFIRPTIPDTRDVVPVVSVVVPAFNEAENIPLLYRRVGEVLQKMVGKRWELILVDDGSRDATWSVICGLAADDPKVLGVRLSRNFGHQFALLAGLEIAQGEAVITMDCDLQHPVEMLPVLFENWCAGFKVVKTLRQDVCDVGWFKGWTSRNFYRLFSYLSGVRLQPGVADFRLMDRQVLHELLRFGEQGLFLRGLTEWIGFSSCSIPYNADPRACGQPQYSLRKMISLAWKGVSSFSIMPLRVGIVIGVMGSLLSLFGVCYAFFGKIIGAGVVPGWASTLMVLSFLFLLLFIYLGILGEYVGRIVIEVRGRPRFIVRETAGFGSRRPFPYE